MRIPLIFNLAILLLLGVQTTSAQKSSSQIIVSEPLEMPGLDRSRRLRIYLPPDYSSSNAAFPVLYMHDAQNLFHDSTAYAGEWGVDEMLDSLYETEGFQLVVVGIDNGGNYRLIEMSPWHNEQYRGGEGDQYLDFISGPVREWVQENFHVTDNPEFTAIAGSSMGGFISHYAQLRHPDVFGHVGALSPSYWFSDSIYTFAKSNSIPESHKTFLLIGEKEGDVMLLHSKIMDRLLQDHGRKSSNYKYVQDPEGMHTESFWKKYFIEMIRFLFLE